MGNLETLARKRNTKAIYMQEKKMSLLARHVRGARGLLGWSVEDLAEKSGVGVDAIRRWEAGTQKPRNATRDKVRKAFEDHRIEFTNGDGPGVRLRPRGSAPSLEPEHDSES